MNSLNIEIGLNMALANLRTSSKNEKAIPAQIFEKGNNANFHGFINNDHPQK